MIIQRIPSFCILVFFSLFSTFGFSQNNKAIKFYKKGEKAFEKKLMVEASFQFTQAINSYENYALAYVFRGRSYLGLNKIERAIIDFNKCLQIDASLMVPSTSFSKYIKK